MDDIPQPSTDPYEVGDKVRIYLGPDDPDKAHHDVQCVVTNRHEDDLDEDTGRALDRFTYDVRRMDTDEVIAISFRHRDLVPKPD